MSGEADSAIQDIFVDKLGAKYPLVRINKADVAAYGIKAYPSAYVLDPDGNVFSTPDGGMPSDGTIEELLKKVVAGPKLPKDARYDPLRSLFKKGEYLKVRDFLDKNLAAPNLDAEMKEVFTAQRASIDKRAETTLARITALGAGPDYAASEDALEKIEKQWKGLPPADAAVKERARFGADPAIKKELAAGRALQKLIGSFDMGKVAQRRKLADELGRFAKKYEGTHAGKQAQTKAGAIASG